MFWVEPYLERAICIRLDDCRCCDFGVTASCMNPLDVEWGFAYVSCCDQSCYGSLPFRKRSKMNLLLRQDEFPWRALSVVDEEDNKSKDQQYRDDDGCEDFASGHGLVTSILKPCDESHDYKRDGLLR